MRIFTAMLLVVYAVMWVGGVVARPTGATWASPLFLALAATLAFRFAGTKSAGWLVLAGAIGFVSEIVGVRFGIPFGAYEYTGELGGRVLGVPPAIVCAWIILVAYGRAIFGPERIWWPAIWMTAIDLVIDPLAANPLGYWHWSSAGAYFGVPLSNFAGWLLVSAVIFATCKFQAAKEHAWLGLSIVGFFSMIAVAHRLWVPALAGFLLCGLHFFLTDGKLHLQVLKRVDNDL